MRCVEVVAVVGTKNVVVFGKGSRSSDGENGLISCCNVVKFQKKAQRFVLAAVARKLIQWSDARREP